MWFFYLLILLGEVSSMPTDVSADCAACQMFSIVLTKATNYHEGINSAFMNICSEIPQCKTILTHCEIVKSLTSIHPANITSKTLQSSTKLHSHLQTLLPLCEQEPLAEVLSNKTEPVQCPMCIAIYYVLESIKDGVLQKQLLDRVDKMVQLACFYLTALKHLHPPLCQALSSGGLAALVKAITDSLGSVYDLIAVGTMGCPSYQTLFETCS